MKLTRRKFFGMAAAVPVAVALPAAAVAVLPNPIHVPGGMTIRQGLLPPQWRQLHDGKIPGEGLAELLNETNEILLQVRAPRPSTRADFGHPSAILAAWPSRLERPTLTFDTMSTSRARSSTRSWPRTRVSFAPTSNV